GLLGGERWSERRGANVLDSGAPWYDTYETKDAKFVAVGAIEPKFYHELIDRLGLDVATLPDQHDGARWPELRTAFERAFAARTRDEWAAVFDGSDACVAPVLTFSEARADPHALARDAYATIGTIEQPAAAPRFARTPGGIRRPPPQRGELGRDALRDWGFDATQIGELAALGLGMLD
ncbi:MAG: CoA transferase, partial [Caldimonas sp.]